MMILTNDLNEYSLLNMLKSCCKNNQACTDDCKIKDICDFANVEIDVIDIGYIDTRNKEEK